MFDSFVQSSACFLFIVATIFLEVIYFIHFTPKASFIFLLVSSKAGQFLHVIPLFYLNESILDPQPLPSISTSILQVLLAHSPSSQFDPEGN